jgi:PTS system mannose-specific IIC component
MFVKSLLLALWAGWCSFDDQGPQMLRRPLLVCPVVGLVLGDMHSALVIGATLELMWMGLGNMAGYTTPDMIVGTIVGATFSILNGSDIAVGVALATTVAVLCQQLNLLVGLIKQSFAPWADRLALTGDFDSILRIEYTGAALQFLMRAVPTFIVIYFGSGVVDKILAVVPSTVLSALNVGSRILPAVGLSILMTVIMKKGMWFFLLFGFCLNAYLGVDILGTTIMSFAFAALYLWIMEVKEKQDKLAAAPAAKPADADQDEEVYDL